LFSLFHPNCHLSKKLKFNLFILYFYLILILVFVLHFLTSIFLITFFLDMVWQAEVQTVWCIFIFIYFSPEFCHVQIIPANFPSLITFNCNVACVCSWNNIICLNSSNLVIHTFYLLLEPKSISELFLKKKKIWQIVI
jgi:hypothetical protein